MPQGAAAENKVQQKHTAAQCILSWGPRVYGGVLSAFKVCLYNAQEHELSSYLVV